MAHWLAPPGAARQTGFVKRFERGATEKTRRAAVFLRELTNEMLGQ